MASELRVNTLKDASGNNSIATSVVASGSAKGWAAANTTAGVTDSFNISTGTDHGTGDYTLAITNALSSVNYSAPIVCYGNTTGAIPINHFARTTASVIGCKIVSHSNSALDQSWDVTISGDLA